MKQDEFYIGWMPASPTGLTRYNRQAVWILLALIIIAGIILSLQQRKFSSASFEYGRLTEVTGTYQSFPVPSLKVQTKQDLLGNSSFITMPLVGYGKSGADGVIRDIQKELNQKLDNTELTLRGTLIYADGKSLLQIDANDKPLIAAGKNSLSQPVIKELGEVELSGEILDPKCYFGVMKPGSGKPHRDCAIRCIAGGINPVFYVRNEKGEAGYYLLLDENGKRFNEQVKDNVGEPVTLSAKAVQYDDWVVLYVKPGTIKRKGGLSWFKSNDGTISCLPGQK